MAAKRRWTEEQLEQMRELFHSDIPMSDVGIALGCDFHRSVRPYWAEWFGEQAIRDRFRRLCALSKDGEKNPMFGKTKELHPRYVTEYVNWQGYRFVDAPDWYEGSKKGTKAAEHVVIGLQKYGLTSLPPKHVIHHKDEDKLNNDPDNLELMTISEHMTHHANLKV